MKITEDQKNILLELCNVGMSKAAKQLSILLNGPVFLDNLNIDFLSHKSLEKYVSQKASDTMAIVHQALSKGLEGYVALAFQSTSTQLLLEQVVGEVPNLSEIEIRSCEQEAMLEIGNIVISSCVTAIVDMVQRKTELSTPSYYEGTLGSIFFDDEKFNHRHEGDIAILSTVLTTDVGKFEGHLIFLLTSVSLREMLEAFQALYGLE